MVISNKQLLDEVFVISVISHDVGLHDVIGGHQASIHREDLWRIEFCIWLRPRTVHVIHACFVCDEIINSLCSRPSAARFARIIHCFEENNDKHTVARNLN